MARSQTAAWLVAGLMTAAAAGCGGGAHSPPPSSTAGQGVKTRTLSVPWTLASGRGRVIAVRWTGGGCRSFDRNRVTESSRAVTIAVLVRDVIPGGGLACPADAIEEVDRVVLRRPLAGRRLRHAPTDAYP